MLEKYVLKAKEKIKCDICGAMIQRGNKIHHQATKKCKHHNYKTVARERQNPASGAGLTIPASPTVSKSKSKLIEINLKGEYDKMTETLNPKKKTSKEMKYQCGACGCMFNNLQDGKCPDCAEQLQ